MEEFFLTTNGVRLHVVAEGPADGPLALLLHGFPEHWYSWRRQLPVLAEMGYRAVAPDQRGYNLSDKPPQVAAYALDVLAADMAGLIRALQREQAIIIGHDWGGAVAYRLAMDYPQLVSRLVVMNSPHPNAFARELRTFSQLSRLLYFFYFQLPWLPEAVFNLAPRFWAGVFFRSAAVNKQAFTEGDLAVMAGAMSQPGAMRSMLHWYRAAVRYPPKSGSPPIGAPTRIIWAEDDIALGKALTRGMEPWFGPDFRIDYIPHCGHWVQNEAAEQVNRLLRAFLGAP